MGIWTGGDSWQSEPWRHRGDNLPINRMHRRDIRYRAISVPPACAQRDRRFKTSHPPASPIPGDELWLRAGSKHHQELPQQAPNSSIHSYILGRCFLKQLGSHQLWSWEGGATQPKAAAQRASPHPLGALLNRQTACKPWGRKRQNTHLQSINTDHPTKTVQTFFQRRAYQSPGPPDRSRVPAAQSHAAQRVFTAFLNLL